jgi:serine/threonine protein kinase
MDDIRCERTKNFIQDLGFQPGWGWPNIMAHDERETNEMAINLISQFMDMDADKRIDVNQAIYHPFFKSYWNNEINEGACPFKVRLYPPSPHIWTGWRLKNLFKKILGQDGYGCRRKSPS